MKKLILIYLLSAPFTYSDEIAKRSNLKVGIRVDICKLDGTQCLYGIMPRTIDGKCMSYYSKDNIASYICNYQLLEKKR